jgi:hypothetical protein
VKLARYHDGDMYLPVDVYRRDGQEVTLIGMIHVAPADFYDRVRTLIDAHTERGDRILVEGIAYIGDDAGLGEHDQELIARYKLLRERANMISEMVAEATGMITQLAAFPRWMEWELADVTALEMMRLRHVPAPPDLDPLMESEIRRVLNKPRVSRGAYWLVKTTPALAAALMPLRVLADGVVLHHRNRVAVLKTLERAENAVLPWGAAHLPGMGKLLAHNGFSHVDRTWNLALERSLLDVVPAGGGS